MGNRVCRACAVLAGRPDPNGTAAPHPTTTSAAAPLLNEGHVRPHASGTSPGESLDWLNEIVLNLWPQVNTAVQKILPEQVTEQIRECVPEAIKGSIRFDEFTLGNVAPQFGPIKVVRQSTGGIRIEVGVDYKSNLHVQLAVSVAKIGIKAIHLRGTLIMCLDPLIEEVPVIGGVVVYFLDPPDIDLDFTGIGNVCDVPGIAGIVRSAIDSCVEKAIVMPNVIAVPMGTKEQGVDPVFLRCPRLKGVLRVTALRAAGLTGADWNLISKKTSDPFLRVTIADQIWRCPTVSGTCDPEWTQDNVFNFLVYDRYQKLKIEVFDADYLRDELIGCIEPMRLADAVNRSETPIRVLNPKTGDAAGEAFLRFEWFEITSMEAATQYCVVDVTARSVFLPANIGKECALRVKLGGIVKSTPVMATPDLEGPGSAVSQSLQDVAKRGKKKGLDDDTIAEITGLAKEDVVAVLSDPLQSAKKAEMKSANGIAARIPLEVPIEFVLHFVTTRADMESAKLCFSLVDKKGKPIAKNQFELPLSDVADNSSTGPAVFEGDDGLNFKAHIGVTLRGLQPGLINP